MSVTKPMRIERTIKPLKGTNTEVWLENHYGKVVVFVAVPAFNEFGRPCRVVFRTTGFHVEC